MLPRPPSVQALQFRLREDLKAAGGDLASFDQLKEASGVGGVDSGSCCGCCDGREGSMDPAWQACTHGPGAHVIVGPLRLDPWSICS